MLANLREQMNALLEGQSSTHHLLYELRQSRPIPQDNTEVLERLDMIERTESVRRDIRRKPTQIACIVAGPTYYIDPITRASIPLHHDMLDHL